jgi:hypothetical protein
MSEEGGGLPADPERPADDEKMIGPLGDGYEVERDT